jgi:hypothetical protein
MASEDFDGRSGSKHDQHGPVRQQHDLTRAVVLETVVWFRISRIHGKAMNFASLW